MKTGTVLVATLFAAASFPILAQQPPMDNPASQPPAAQPQAPPGTQPTPDSPAGNPSGAPAAQQTSPAATPEASAPTPAVAMSPVNGELVSKLDSKTAKNGDDVVVETKASAKTADGTEIPKGSKLVGHVVGVQSSKAGQNSEVVLQFDRAQLKGGQSLPIHSVIQSLEPAEGAAAGGSDSAANSGMSRPSTGAANPSPGGDNGGGSTGNAGASAASAPGYAGGAAGAGASAGSDTPAAGTVVARTGSIAIRATSIPGVLLANNEPGQQDPRMGQASSILLGAKQDVQLEGGTKIVIGVAPASAASAGATTKE